MSATLRTSRSLRVARRASLTFTVLCLVSACSEPYPEMPRHAPHSRTPESAPPRTAAMTLPEFVAHTFGEGTIDCDRYPTHVEAVVCARSSHRDSRPFFIREPAVTGSFDRAWDVVPPGPASAQISLLGYAGDEEGSIFQLFHVAERGIRIQRLWSRRGGSAHAVRAGGFVTPPLLEEPFQAPHEPTWDPAIVILEVTVGADGEVRDVEVRKEINGGAAKAAATLITSRRFRPATLLGENVDSIHNLSVAVRDGTLTFPHE